MSNYQFIFPITKYLQQRLSKTFEQKINKTINLNTVSRARNKSDTSNLTICPIAVLPPIC